MAWAHTSERAARGGPLYAGLRVLLGALLVSMLSTLASTHAAAQRAHVSMSASGTRVAVGEPFAVEIRVDTTGSTAEDVRVPDFGKLEVLGRRVSRPFSFSFGFGTGGQHAMVQSQVVYGFTLRALAPGTYQVPPAVAVVDGRKVSSQGLTIEATGAAMPSPGVPTPSTPGSLSSMPSPNASAPPDGPLDGATFDRDLFVRTVVDKKRAYVGEQVTVTVYLYVRGSLHQSPTITREPTSDGFWVQDLLPPQRSLAAVQQQVNGRNFNVYVLRRFAAFPLRPGTLDIGAPAVELETGGSIFDLLNGPSPPTRRTGVEVEVEVQALPPRTATNRPVHVGSLTLDAILDPPSAKVGDAATLRVTAKGLGNLKALELPTPRVDGAEVLAPEIDDRLSTDLDQVGGEREIRWLVLPRKPGAHVIPALSVEVFDPANGTYHVVSTSALTLDATGSAATQADAAAEETPRDEQSAPRFDAARRTSELRRRSDPVHRAPWFPIALWLGPAALLLTSFARSLRTHLRAGATRTGAARTFQAAQARLDEAAAATRDGDSQRALSALAFALKRSLEARLEEPIGGLTREALRAHLVARGMGAPLAERIVSQLEACELARFDPAGKSRAELETALEKARGTLRELERFSPAKEAS